MGLEFASHILVPFLCVCAAVTVVSLLVLARQHGVNLSALGIGVDFLQVVSMYVADQRVACVACTRSSWLTWTLWIPSFAAALSWPSHGSTLRLHRVHTQRDSSCLHMSNNPVIQSLLFLVWLG